jgi:hypothetical protein
MESGDGQLKQFLLVPCFGPCAHSPPSPVNQIIYVMLPAVWPLHTTDAVWDGGTLKTQRQDSPGGMSSCSMQGISAEPHTQAEMSACSSRNSWVMTAAR